MEIGTKVIVRCRDAGVHYGTYAGHTGREVRLTDGRRIWRWHGALTLHEVATLGVQDDSRISAVVPEVILLEACEIITCTEAAIVKIADVRWTL